MKQLHLPLSVVCAEYDFQINRMINKTRKILDLSEESVFLFQEKKLFLILLSQLESR